MHPTVWTGPVGHGKIIIFHIFLQFHILPKQKGQAETLLSMRMLQENLHTNFSLYLPHNRDAVFQAISFMFWLPLNSLRFDKDYQIAT